MINQGMTMTISFHQTVTARDAMLTNIYSDKEHSPLLITAKMSEAPAAVKKKVEKWQGTKKAANSL